jgi:hypothetical protein
MKKERAMVSKKKRKKSQASRKTRRAKIAFQHTFGWLNSTGDRDTGLNKDPLITAFRKGFGDDDGTKVDLKQRSAKGKYGKNDGNVLQDCADQLIVIDQVQLIIACGGIVSARAAATAAAKTTPPTPVLICIGQDNSGAYGTNVAGVNLQTPGENAYRASLLKARYGLASEDNIWLVVNSNSAMGKSESDQWATAGRPFVETGRSGHNDETKLKTAFDYAVDAGAQAFVVSSDPFFTSNAKKVYAIIKGTGLPACYPLREYLTNENPDPKYVSWGPNLVDAYEEIGKQAKTVFTFGAPFPTITLASPSLYP